MVGVEVGVEVEVVVEVEVGVGVVMTTPYEQSWSRQQPTHKKINGVDGYYGPDIPVEPDNTSFQERVREIEPVISNDGKRWRFSDKTVVAITAAHRKAMTQALPERFSETGPGEPAYFDDRKQGWNAALDAVRANMEKTE